MSETNRDSALGVRTAHRRSEGVAGGGVRGNGRRVGTALDVGMAKHWLLAVGMRWPHRARLQHGRVRRRGVINAGFRKLVVLCRLPIRMQARRRRPGPEFSTYS